MRPEGDPTDALRNQACAAGLRRQTWLILAAAAVLYGLLRVSLGPLPQDPAYHLLADTRTWLGVVPRAGDVLTNAAILAAGLFGVALGTIATDHTKALSASGHSLASALTGGYHLAYLVAAICVAGGILAAFFVLRPPAGTVAQEVEEVERAGAQPATQLA